MRLQIDSIQWVGTRAIETLEQQLTDLTSSLRESETHTADLQTELATAEQEGGDPERVASLRRELQEANTGLRNRQVAAGLNFRTIQERNRHAVARIFVEFENGEVVTATDRTAPA